MIPWNSKKSPQTSRIFFFLNTFVYLVAQKMFYDTLDNGIMLSSFLLYLHSMFIIIFLNELTFDFI